MNGGGKRYFRGTTTRNGCWRFIESMNAAIEPTADIAAFYESVFDPKRRSDGGLTYGGASSPSPDA